MATYTAFVRAPTGQNIYAKPLPLATAPWSTGVVNFTETATTGSYSATLDDSFNYEVFRRTGASPASTDSAFWMLEQLFIPPTAVAISEQIASDIANVEGSWDSAQQSFAGFVESALLNETDGQQLLAAIGARVQQLFDAGADVPVSTLISLIRADLERSGGSLNTLTTRIPGILRTKSEDETAEASQTADLEAAIGNVSFDLTPVEQRLDAVEAKLPPLQEVE